MSSTFYQEFNSFLNFVYPNFKIINKNKIQVISFPDFDFKFQLIGIPCSSMTAVFESIDKATLNIYEDQWYRCRKIIGSRVKNKLGLNQTIPGRACKIIMLNKTEMDEFLNANHLLGAVTCQTKFGLTYKDDLVAVIGFSKSRVMTDSQTYYRSYELLRFANKNNYTVTGGLNKLLQTFIKEKNAKHIMSYIDLDWGWGNSFERIGFKEASILPPQEFYINPETNNRIWKNEVLRNNTNTENFILIKNSGSRKMILDLREI